MKTGASASVILSITHQLIQVQTTSSATFPRRRTSVYSFLHPSCWHFKEFQQQLGSSEEAGRPAWASLSVITGFFFPTSFLPLAGKDGSAVEFQGLHPSTLPPPPQRLPSSISLRCLAPPAPPSPESRVSKGRFSCSSFSHPPPLRPCVHSAHTHTHTNTVPSCRTLINEHLRV